MDLRKLMREAKERREAFVSVCTGNFDVIEMVLEFVKKSGEIVLMESTSNQVNQEGGYTGLKPADFVKKLMELSERIGLDWERIVLGGDHLGPLPWRDLDSEKAMEKGKKLIESYVRAGYRKIHLDTSFPLGNEEGVTPEIVAERQAELCRIAEKTWREEGLEPPVYVLGTEVPAAGGVVEEEDYVTSADEFEEEVEVTEEIFKKRGCEEAWERVVAFVVQPGIEFFKNGIRLYDPEKTRRLRESISKYHFAFEAHSTDFQPLHSLRLLVENGFVILKVGPELTFKYREALFALESIERELNLPPSGLLETLIKAMKENPKHWRRYYDGSLIEMKYSLLDRIRYYWNVEEVRRAKEKLLGNLKEVKLNVGLVSQYFPEVSIEVISGEIKPLADELIKAKIFRSLERYSKAIKGE